MATEADTACLHFAGEYTEAAELVAIIHPDNRASERVAEKMGWIVSLMIEAETSFEQSSA